MSRALRDRRDLSSNGNALRGELLPEERESVRLSERNPQGALMVGD